MDGNTDSWTRLGLPKRNLGQFVEIEQLSTRLDIYGWNWAEYYGPSPTLSL